VRGTPAEKTGRPSVGGGGGLQNGTCQVTPKKEKTGGEGGSQTKDQTGTKHRNNVNKKIKKTRTNG